MTIVYAAIACGIIAVLYGFITSQQVLRAPAGNEHRALLQRCRFSACPPMRG